MPLRAEGFKPSANSSSATPPSQFYEGMEAASGFEPLHRGFADLRLSHLATPPCDDAVRIEERVERETGFEPATPTLARSCSTTELFPRHRFPRHSATWYHGSTLVSPQGLGGVLG